LDGAFGVLSLEGRGEERPPEMRLTAITLLPANGVCGTGGVAVVAEMRNG
jgi:hypothetical protein